MRRRDLLKGGVAAAALGSPGSVSAADPVDRVLQRIDERIERLRARTGPFLAELPSFLAEPGLDTALGGALESLVAYGAVATLSEDEQSDERVQTRLKEAARLAGESLDRCARELDTLDDETLETLHATLADRPDLVDAGLEALADETETLDIPKRAREQLLTTARRTAFDLTRGQKSGATRRHLARYHRLKRKVAEADDPRALLVQPPESERRARRAAAEGNRPDRTTPEAHDPAQPSKLDRVGREVFGALLLAFGVTNTGVYVVGVVVTQSWMLWCICVGVPLLAAGILLIVAGMSLIKSPDEH